MGINLLIKFSSKQISKTQRKNKFIQYFYYIVFGFIDSCKA